MKILLSLALLASLNLNAAETQFVACTVKGKWDYNTYFTVRDDEILSYTLVDYDKWFEEAVEVTSLDTQYGDLWLQWGQHWDTNYGYVLTLKNDLLNNWSIQQWTSGNDSDNHQEEVDETPIRCDLLKEKPVGISVDSENIERTL